jgi:peptidoglycan hydrolase CwlO-like protein
MKKFAFILLPIILAVFVATSFADDVCEGQEECTKKEAEIQKKLDQLRGKETSLANEIAYMDGQINLTQVRIQNSIAKIDKTTKDIAKLADNIEEIKGRLGKLESSIEYQKKVLDARLRSRYKIQESSPVIVLFGSDNINKMIQKAEYLQFLELQDNKMLVEMDKTKTAYNKQKDIFQEKKDESEKLRADLEREKINLDAYKGTLLDQQAEKKNLLAVTQNDEAKYQKLLAEVQRELNQITGAVSVLKNQPARKVKKGEQIGTQGNTGNSSGDHLHFGVYRYESFSQIDGWNWYYSNYSNPDKVLKSKSVYWNDGCSSSGYKNTGKGDWAWPLSSPTISQGFGHTCWSNVYYGGKDHPAYDMYGPYGAPVYAVDDGEAYFCKNCLGDGGNGVFIFHDDNYMTLYWHLR